MKPVEIPFLFPRTRTMKIPVLFSRTHSGLSAAREGIGAWGAEMFPCDTVVTCLGV